MPTSFIWTSSRPNITLHLRDREKGCANLPTYRRNCQMWRTLICDERAVYKRVWSISSKSMIHCLGCRLYLDDFKTCYCLNGLNAMPTLIYKNKTHNYKIKAYLHCSAELSTLPLENGGHRPYILALTKCQYLIRIDLETGHILMRIFLGSTYNYKYLNWDIFPERAVICSTQSKNSTGLKSFVLVNVFPLEVIGQVTVSKEVFGADICDANISDGMLVLMHRNDKVKIYNLEKIMEQSLRFPLKLGEKPSTGSSASFGYVGSFPSGIPTNIHITECPAVLLEVKCFNRDVFFGGYPWHYMYIPYHNDPLLPSGADVGNETYLISRVSDNKLIENGPLEMECDSDGEIKAFFHMDDSQRIIQLSDYEVIVNAFNTREDGKSELKPVFTLTPPRIQSFPKTKKRDELTHWIDEEVVHDDWEDWETTSSGRWVNTRWRERFALKNVIREVNYDQELDFLLMSYIQRLAESSLYTADKGKLQIHCNQTGRLLKTVDLDGVGCEFRHCFMEMDVDLMIHIFVEDALGTVVCNLYRLQRSDYPGQTLEMKLSNIESDFESDSESDSSISI